MDDVRGVPALIRSFVALFVCLFVCFPGEFLSASGTESQYIEILFRLLAPIFLFLFVSLLGIAALVIAPFDSIPPQQSAL